MRGLIVIAVAFLIWAQASLAPAQRIILDMLPTTVEGVVRDIIARLSAEDRALVKSTRKQDLIKFHHGWGTHIRNRYGLWQSSSNLIQEACGGPCHPDDASMLIIQAVWQTLQK
ncbi:MAG TPA: DUF6794 domain-containing protein [Xanthobacteraceae bacterium]|nr:DUF6794 domain-containing protein [Xanthobacteraceae bacterium]